VLLRLITNYLRLGHWIQACPTNNDPKFDGKYRVKRSTGIPRSLQTKVEKPDSLAPDGSNDDSRNTGVMVNADGDFVVARPDKAAWELYQEKAKASAAAAAEAAAAEESKVLQARGLECPIDKRMFLEPTQTPCCHRTYCNDCISNALIESDFVCPGCSTEGVLLDNLTTDDETASKIKAYEAEKAEAKKEKEKQPTISTAQNGLSVNGTAAAEQDFSKDTELKERSPSQQGDDASTQSKKRPAEDEPEKTDIAESVNVSKKQKSEEDQPETAGASTVPTTVSTTASNPKEAPANLPNPTMPFNPQMPFGDFSNMMPSFPNGGFGNDAMPFMNPMGMPNGFPNAMGPGWNPMNMPFPQMQGNMYGNQNNGFPNMFNDPSMMFPMGGMGGAMPNQNPSFQNPAMNNFANQQRTTFSGPYSREEDSPYFRQPVNPQRHQARNRRVRPSDYREL
jgi:protein MPE1